MKRWKKIALVVVGLVVLVQLPFVYRRIQLGKLSEKITTLNASRIRASDSRFRELSGVIHVHTALGGHSEATFEELIEGSKGLDFVILTEHTSDKVDTAAKTLNGTYGGVLFVGGNELDTHTSDRLLMIPGTSEAYARRNTETPEFLPPFQKEGRLVFVTYPERFSSWKEPIDGVEIFNLNSNSRKTTYGLFLMDALWSFRKYPELTLATHLSRPDFDLQKYDQVARTRRVTLFAGSDAHSNLGFHLLGDDSGNKFVNFKFDSFDSVFKIVRTHLLLAQEKMLTQETLLDTLRQGHGFVGFDVLGDTSGFRFFAGDKIMGDEVPLADAPSLMVSVPQTARVVMFKDGSKVFETLDMKGMTFAPKEPGAYRVEVFLDSLGKPFDTLPWILSNPIYVK
jgi:hypothetical protein